MHSAGHTKVNSIQVKGQGHRSSTFEMSSVSLATDTSQNVVQSLCFAFVCMWVLCMLTICNIENVTGLVLHFVLS